MPLPLVLRYFQRENKLTLHEQEDLDQYSRYMSKYMMERYEGYYAMMEMRKEIHWLQQQAYANSQMNYSRSQYSNAGIYSERASPENNKYESKSSKTSPVAPAGLVANPFFVPKEGQSPSPPPGIFVPNKPFKPQSYATPSNSLIKLVPNPLFRA